MNIITEEHIENLIDRLEVDEELFLKYRQNLIDNEPALAGFLAQESFDILNDDEYDLLWFVITLIYTVFTEKNNLKKPLEAEVIDEIEEVNWELLNQKEKASFSERLDAFFEETEQEDLMAFLEDCIVPDEEVDITPVGRELIFIAGATLINVLEIAAD